MVVHDATRLQNLDACTQGGAAMDEPGHGFFLVVSASAKETAACGSDNPSTAALDPSGTGGSILALGGHVC